MAATGNHIVNKVVYHVHGVPVNKAFSIKEEASAYIKTGFSNKLQAVFDKYFSGTESIYIDKLQLDLVLKPGEIDLGSYEKQLLDLLEKQLQKNAVTSKPVKRITAEKESTKKISELIQAKKSEHYSPADALIYFLEKGYLPWWFKTISSSAFEQELTIFFNTANNYSFSLVAKCILDNGQKSVFRFIHQFSDDFKYKLVAAFFQQNSDVVKTLHKKIIEATNKPSSPLGKIQAREKTKKVRAAAGQLDQIKTDHIFWNLCLQIIESGNSFQQFEKEIMSAAKKTPQPGIDPPQKSRLLQNMVKESINEQTQVVGNDVLSEKNEQSDVAGEIFINNAGLVLLHPFLKPLFDVLCVTKDEKITDHAKAIACLNYLCGYDEMQPEYEWPLMKILCGMQLSETVEQLVKLTDADKLECNALLQQVIDYWIALKQTSTEGLQQTFIQRFGKLSANENGWMLQVEQKTVDILKDRLPWGVSMVKLAWMKQLLIVEW